MTRDNLATHMAAALSMGPVLLAARALHNNLHRRCERGDHALPIGAHGAGHFWRCDHLVTDQVAIPWDQPPCPDSCWSSFMAEGHNNPHVVEFDD